MLGCSLKLSIKRFTQIEFEQYFLVRQYAPYCLKWKIRQPSVLEQVRRNHCCWGLRCKETGLLLKAKIKKVSEG